MKDNEAEMSGISAAGRLFQLISAAANHDGSKGILAVFALVGGRPESDHTRGLETLAGTFRLIEMAKNEVLRHPELKQTLFMGALNSVENILRTANFSNEWRVIQPQLQQTLIGLEFSAERLNWLADEVTIAADDLNSLLAATEDLQKEVLDAEIDADLKSLIVRKLEEIREAILNYRLCGAERLRGAVDSSVGGLVRRADSIQKASKVKEVAAFLDLLTKLDAVASKAWKYAALAGPAIRAFLHGGPPLP